MTLIPLAPAFRLPIGAALIVAGLIAVAVGALVAFLEHGAALRSWIGAPLLGRHEHVGALRWWVTPIEKHAFARRFTTTEDLNDVVVMDDGRTILVVGDSGTLLKSVNAGATWRSLANSVEWREGTPPDGRASVPPLFPPALESIAASPDGSLAIAVGQRGTVLTSDDYGTSWTRRASSSSASLNSVALDANSGQAIAVGDEGTVLASDDYGMTWTERVSGSSASLNSVALDAGSGRAIAVGDEGTVLASDDYGMTWTERVSGSSASLYSVALDASSGQAIAVGNASTVLTSDNSGTSWTRRTFDSSAWLRSVAFDASSGRAIAVGLSGTALTSVDYGASWTRRTSGSPARLRSVAFDASSGRAIAVGYKGTMLTSVNYGVSWAERASGSSTWLKSVAFDASSERAIAVGLSGTALTSADYSASWTERASGSSASLYSVAFDASSGRAIAVGHKGTMLTSDDDGMTWTERVSGSSASLYSVAFDASSGHAIAVGSSGTVLTSDDDGESWTERDSGSSASLYSVAFDAGTGRAIAVGHKGTMLTSVDYGLNWVGRASSSSVWLKSVAFDASSGRAIAVGSFGTVLTSDDDGESWTERDTDSWVSLESIAFDTSTRRAIAVGSSGTVLTSDDDGASWTERASGSSAWLESVAFDGSSGHAIAVGNEATLLASDDAGTTWSILVHGGRIYPAPLGVLGLLLILGGLTILRCQPTGESRTSGRGIIDRPASDRSRGSAEPDRNRSAEKARGSGRGIVDWFVSDRPLGSGEQDRLAFGRYVKGLSGLLRNPGTGFPITIAVTGEWGTGKSSFMRLLEDDLGSNRYFPAWFNAWHDQSEENVLSSLLLAIRGQAIPRIFSRSCYRAVELRLNLLHSRGVIYVVAVAIPILLVVAAVFAAWHEHGGLPSWKEDVRPAIQASIGTYEPVRVTPATVGAVCDALSGIVVKSPERLDTCNERLGKLMANEKGTIAWSSPARLQEAIEHELGLSCLEFTVEVQRALLDSDAHVATPSLRTALGKLWPKLMGGLWQWLTALAAAVIVIANGASAFGFNLRRGAAGFRSPAANSVDPAGRHEQLRRDFKNVSRSIGRHLVIFIDDLDRCQPEKVVETLEAVNFLVTAGECAVVMGMDYRRIQHCVGLVRKELAEAEYADSVHEGDGTGSRTAYAHQYLQKLINVEMPIAAERDLVKNLVTKPGPTAGEQATSDPFRSMLSSLRRPRIWVVPATVVLGVWLVVPYMHDAFVPAEPFEVVAVNADDEGQRASTGRQTRPPVADEQPAPPRDDDGPSPTTTPPPGTLHEDAPPDDEGQRTSTGRQTRPPAADEQPAPPRDDDGSGPTTTPPPDTTRENVNWPAILGLLLVLILILAFRPLNERGWRKLADHAAESFRRLRGVPETVRDSETFRSALDIWSDVIVRDDPTPRTLKRFINRLRYFAAMLHAEHGAGFDWRREANLVALAALHHLDVDIPLSVIPGQPDLFQQDGGVANASRGSGVDDGEADHTRSERILEACRSHADPRSWETEPGVRVESPWPPDESEIDQFRKLCAGIHM